MKAFTAPTPEMGSVPLGNAKCSPHCLSTLLLSSSSNHAKVLFRIPMITDRFI